MAGTDVPERPITPSNQTVHVIGGGVAGLTAAHKLAVRGFAVVVFEREVAFDAEGLRRLALGGMARTQYAPPPKTAGAMRDLLDHAWPTRAARSSLSDLGPPAPAPVGPSFPMAIAFAQGEAEVSKEDAERLHALAHGLANRAEHELRVSVHAFADATGADATSPPPEHGDLDAEAADEERLLQDLVRERAEHVTEILRSDLGSDLADRVVIPWHGPQSLRPVADGLRPDVAARLPPKVREHNRWVIVTLDRVMLPGEHGFRFFPWYYRHVFETMAETPLLDARGEESGRTVLDNVVSTPDQGVVSASALPFIFTRNPPGSEYERTQQLELFARLGYDAQDLTQFLLRVARYMCTCSERRAAELEDISWWDWLEGRDGPGRPPRYRYGAKFAEAVKSQAQMLAAFRAEQGDARTNGNTYVQLFYNWITKLPRSDGTLTAPTSEAWFDPWRDYLKSIGVVFVRGELDRFELRDGQLEAHFANPSDACRDRAKERPEYYVLATDVVSAERVTKRLPPVGALANLAGYTTRVTVPGHPTRERDPSKELGVFEGDRLQPASGIQYFFTTEFRLNAGYVYFGDTAWGLTSINPQQFWTWRPTLERDGFAAMLSVDIFAFFGKPKDGPVRGKTLPECTEPEIAEEIWRQIEVAVGVRPAARALPPPRWFHIDDHLEFGPDGRLARNTAAYLVPIKGDWKKRPGANPWDPTPTDHVLAMPPSTPSFRDVWQARHGGYEVHFGQLVLAGVYMRTFTRMTTMESANESARHAVNAILDHFNARFVGAGSGGVSAGDRGGEGQPTSGQHMNSKNFYRTTRVGDYCRIWDPERNELPEMVPWKEADELLFRRGLPHVWDVLGIEDLPTLLSWAPRLSDLAGAFGVPVAPLYDGGGGDDAAARLREAILVHLGRLRQTIDETTRRGGGERR